MVKRREVSKRTREQIEAFGAGAEVLENENVVQLDNNAPRSYKAIRVPFNEYEFRQLEKASVQTGRTKLNFIRRAILLLADEVL